MLTLSIDVSYDFDIQDESETRFAAGSNYIESFPSRHLVTSRTRTAHGIGVWVGEDKFPLHESLSLEKKVKALQYYHDAEGVLVHVDSHPAQLVLIARTGAGSCPIYVSYNAKRLVASWRFEEAVHNLDRLRADREACRIYLEHGASVVREMVISGVYMLWPGESVTFDGTSLKFSQVDTPAIVLPGTLDEAARATDEFVRLIGAAIERQLLNSIAPIVELSGGLDSSCVAIGANRVRRGLLSYAVVHEGAMGRQQRKRRSEIVKLLDSDDYESPSYRPGAFESLALSECSFTIYDDMYRLPCALAVDAHPNGPADLIITGIGGDELTMESTFGRREWEVGGSVCSSALDAAVGRADMFLRRGIWPKNPLISQSVVDFCRALPATLRAGRLLNRLTLARAGLSDGYMFYRYQEHYGNVVQRECSLFDFDESFQESVIADHQIFDIVPILKQAHEASMGGFSYDLIGRLFRLLKLEVVLRRYLS